MKNPVTGMQLYKGFSISRDSLIKMNKNGDTSTAMQSRSNAQFLVFLILLHHLSKMFDLKRSVYIF